MFVYRLCQLTVASYCLLGISFAPQSQAQIVPDISLGNEKSILTEDISIEEKTVDLIEGGARRGNNLFHSFEEFNISEHQKLYFASPPDISDIFTRITGTNTSEILGTLGMIGNANLFLLNPNGILFGQNSQLDIVGSFLGTTAESFIFENEENFSSTNPDVPALLTVNFPVGLQFGDNLGSIVNRTHQPAAGNIESPAIASPEGLRINPGEKLSLLGGQILVEGGYFTTNEGNIELGAVGANSLLGLTKDDGNWQTNYTEVDFYEDIQLQQQAGIDGGNLGGSQIELRGKNISLGYSLESLAGLNLELEDFYNLDTLAALDGLTPDSSRIVAQNSDSNPPIINLIASDTFSIIDPGLTQQNLIFNTIGSGNAGIANISANNIIFYGAGIESSTLAGATGNSGFLNFQANNMSLQNSFGAIDTFSSGQGGSLKIDLVEDLKIKNGGFTSKVENSGSGGLIDISAQNLEIVNGGFGVNTFGSGNGGLIDLDIANKIIVNSGGFGADTFNEGNGGRIEIEAQNIEFNDGGIGANNTNVGKGGQIVVNTKTISLKNGAITTNSDANFGEESSENQINTGSGGSIFIDTEDLILDNSRIATLGGTVIINVDKLQLLNDSDNILFIDDQSDLEDVFGEDRAEDIQDFIDDDQDENIITGQSDTGQRTLILDNGGEISAGDSQSGAKGVAVVATDIIELLDLSQPESPEPESPESESPEPEFFEFIPPKLDSESPEFSSTDDSEPQVSNPQPQTNLSNNSTFIFRLSNGEQFVVSTQDLQDIVESDGYLNSSSASNIEDQVEMLINGVLISKSYDSNFDLSSACRIGNSNFVSVGKGGVAENPFNIITPNVNIADLGIHSYTSELDSELISSSPFSIQKKSFPYMDKVIEAQNWKINQQGNVELLAATGEINGQVNQSSIVDLPECLKNYFMR